MTISPRSSFSLNGPSISLDPRVHAVRDDLADIALAGQLFAPHYARAMLMRCNVASAMLYGKPSADEKAISQLLFGEDFMVVDVSAGWAWGYCRHDHYVGYVPHDALAPPLDSEVTAAISVSAASLFAKPDANSDRCGALPMGATLRGNRHGDFVQTALGFVHVDAFAAQFADTAAVAERLIGTPYVWGGRSSDGIDCSGLVQLSLALTGHSAPRDSDQQQEALGTEIGQDAPLQRSDLIFFPGHVGIMEDHEVMIHATMHYGKTVREKLSDVVARIALKYETPILARKRIR